MEKATLAAGCFWGVEATFRKVKGVKKVISGYTGGHLSNPTYEDVCSGRTGHAEAVEIEFNPAEISYEDLLNVFWKSHDPTTLNRQGPDVGNQYRSSIFYHSEEQKTAAEISKDRYNQRGIFDRPIVTEIVPASPFFPAEEYHQRYFEKHGMTGCH